MKQNFNVGKKLVIPLHKKVERASTQELDPFHERNF